MSGSTARARAAAALEAGPLDRLAAQWRRARAWRRLAALARNGGPAKAIRHFIESGDIRPSLVNLDAFFGFLERQFGLSWAVEFARAAHAALPSRQTCEFLFSGRVPDVDLREILAAVGDSVAGISQDHEALARLSEGCLRLGLDELAHRYAFRAAVARGAIEPAERARLACLARAGGFSRLMDAWRGVEELAAPPTLPPPTDRRLILLDPQVDARRHLPRLAAGARSVSIYQFGDLYGHFTPPPLGPDVKVRVLHARSSITRFSLEYRRIHETSARLADEIVAAIFSGRETSRTLPERLRSSLALEIADRLFFYMLPLAAVAQALGDREHDQTVIAFGADQRLFQAVMASPGIQRRETIACCLSPDEADRSLFGPRLRNNHAIFSGEGELSLESTLKKIAGEDSSRRRRDRTAFAAFTKRIVSRAAAVSKRIDPAEPREGDRPRLLFVTNETRAYLGAAMDIAAHLQRDFEVSVAYVTGNWDEAIRALGKSCADPAAQNFVAGDPIPAPPPAAEIARLAAAARQDETLTSALLEGEAAEDGDHLEADEHAETAEPQHGEEVDDAASALDQAAAEAGAGPDAADAETAEPEAADPEAARGEPAPVAEATADEANAESTNAAEANAARADAADADADERVGAAAEAVTPAAEGAAPTAGDDEAARAREADAPADKAPQTQDGDDEAPATGEDAAAIAQSARGAAGPGQPPLIDLRQRRISNSRLGKRWGDLALRALAPELADLFARHADDPTARLALNNILPEVLRSLAPAFVEFAAASRATIRRGRFEAVAICPGRPARCFAFGALAELENLPSITFEPHALNATYPRYTKVSTPYATVVSSYFQREYEANFGVPAERCMVVGSPRMRRPADYDSAAARRKARETLELTERDGPAIAFMSQPLGWPHLEGVWRTVLRAALALPRRVTLLLKTHPEDTPARLRDYLAVAAEERASHLVRHVAVGPETTMEASQVILTCYSVLAIEAMLRERPVVIVTQQGRPYPLPYHEVVGAPFCDTPDDLAAELGRLLEPGADVEATRRFRADNPHFFDDGLFERHNQAAMEILRGGPPPPAPGLDDPFVTSEARSFAV